MNGKQLDPPSRGCERCRITLNPATSEEYCESCIDIAEAYRELKWIETWIRHHEETPDILLLSHIHKAKDLLGIKPS